MLRYLPDGSFLSVIGGVKVRVITAAVTVTCHDGTSYGGAYRLATTLLDHRAHSAPALMALYHERWEHEVAYLALHGPRRPRVCARRVKSPLSRWNKHPEGKPRAAHRITSVTAHISAEHHKPATRRRKSVTNPAGP